MFRPAKPETIARRAAEREASARNRLVEMRRNFAALAASPDDTHGFYAALLANFDERHPEVEK